MINSILTATNQEQSTNIVNSETNQMNSTNSTNIASAGSICNSRGFVKNWQFRFGNSAQEFSPIFRCGGGSTISPITQFQLRVNCAQRWRSTTPYEFALKLLYVRENGYALVSIDHLLKVH